jgi:hypothetical protein
VLRRLLLLPLLAPLLSVLLVGAFNSSPWVSLRLLTWRSTALPLGAWIALAGAGGAALSAGGAALALGQGATPLRRQVRRRGQIEAPEPWEGEEAVEPRAWREERRRPASPADWSATGGSRAPGEPAPTVAVPFRVIRRGRSDGEPEGGGGRASATDGAGWRQRTEAVAEPVPAGDGWDAADSDDW